MKNRIMEIVKNEYECEPISVLTPQEFYEEIGIDVSDSLAVAILPGWQVRDEGASIYYPDAEDLDDAVEAFVKMRDWRPKSETQFIMCRVSRLVLRFYEYNNSLFYNELIFDDNPYMYEIKPVTPPCLDGAEHEWCAPSSVLGGRKENPGVWENGEGTISKEVCKNCAKYHGVDTWAQVKGLRGYRREWYEEADEVSKFWANKIALKKMYDIIKREKTVKKFRKFDKYNEIIVEFETRRQKEYIKNRRELERKLEEVLHRPIRCYDLADVPKYEGYDCGYKLCNL